MAEYTDIILETTLFQGVDEEGLIKMMDCLTPRIKIFRKSDYIITAGDPLEHIGIILEGVATLSHESFDGNRNVISSLKPGDLFGEMYAFSSQKRWPVTVQADERSKVFFLPRMKIVNNCSRMCPWHHTLIENFLKTISETMLRLHKKVEYLMIKSMRGKISAYLLDQHRLSGALVLTLPLNRNQMADYLNVSRPSMSRELGKMKKEGIIDYHLNTFRIHNLETLIRMSAQ